MSNPPPMSSYETSDLAMATYLSLNGQTFYLGPSGEDGKALFIFRPVLEEEREGLEKLVQAFTKGRARVEPKRFMREAGAVRGRLYDYIDGKNN